MARDAELKAHITAKDDASKVIDKVADAAKDLEKKPVEVKVDAEVAGVLGALDQVAAEAKATAEAAEALGRALGPELAAKADPGAIVGDLKQMGLSLDQIKGNADQLAAKMRELSDADVGGKLGSSLGTVRGKLDEVNKSADSSKSVLANMVGNATQDLGALGGVAGSAGVAIGQMGEYMSDALSAGDKLGNVIGNFAKIAGPVAGIALFTEVVGKMVAAGKEVEKLNADRANDFFDAIRDGSDAFKVMREEVEKTGALNFGQAGASLFGIAPGIESVLPLLDEAGISFKVWQQLIEEFPSKGSGYLDYLKGLGLSQGEAEEVLNALMQATAAKMDADEKSAQVTKFLGEETKKTSQHVEDLNAAYRNAATDTYAASQDLAADAIQRVNDKLREQADALNEQIDGARAAADSNMAYVDAQDDFIRAVQASLEGEAALIEARKKHGESSKEAQEATDNLNDAYTAERDALIDAANAAQRLASDQAAAAGKQQTATDKVDSFNNALLANARYATPAARQAVYDYLFQVNQIPPEKVSEIQALIDEGKLDEANQKLKDASATRDAAIKADANTAAADRDLDNTANPNGQPRTANIRVQVINPNYGASLGVIGGGPRSLPPAPTGPTVTPFGAVAAAPAPGTTSSTPVLTVPVVFKVPTAAELIRRIGPIRIPLFVQAGLLADRRINGNL